MTSMFQMLEILMKCCVYTSFVPSAGLFSVRRGDYRLEKSSVRQKKSLLSAPFFALICWVLSSVLRLPFPASIGAARFSSANLVRFGQSDAIGPGHRFSAAACYRRFCFRAQVVAGRFAFPRMVSCSG
jgi:hypothetical protein